MSRGGLLGCVLWLAIGAAHAAEPVSFGAALPGTGATIMSDHRTALDLTLTAHTGGRDVRVPLGKTHTQRSVLQVVDATPDPRHLQLSWSVNRQEDHGPDGNRAFDLPVAEKRYSMDLQTGAVGGSATAAERRIVAQAADLFVLQRSLRAMLGDDPIALGERRPAPPMFAGLMRDAPGTPTVVGWLTLRGVEARDGVQCAVFGLALTLTASGELEPGVHADVAAELAGTVVIETASGWTRSLDVAGPVRLTGGGVRHGQRFTFEGAGTFRSTTTVVSANPAGEVAGP